MNKKNCIKVVVVIFYWLYASQLSAQLASGHTAIKLSNFNVNNNTQPATSLIESIRVVAKLPDSTTIGYLSQPQGNETVKLIPEGRVNDWLQSFLDKSLKPTFRSGGAKLLWVIRDIGIGGDSAAVNTFVKLKAEIYTITKNKQLQSMQNVDTILTVSGGQDKNAAAIVTAMQCLLNASTALPTTAISSARAARLLNTVAPLTNNTLTEDSIVTQTIPQANWPIFKDSIYKEGVYASFEEFKNNSPSIKNAIVQIDKKDSNKIMLCQEQAGSTATPIPNAWGMSVGGELYRYQDNALIPIEKADKAIVISRFQDFVIRKNQAIFYRETIGSRNGDLNPFSRAHSYKAIDKAVANIPNPPMATHIDLETGNLSF